MVGSLICGRAQVSGWIRVRDATHKVEFTVEEGPGFRGYGDMNWGRNFPQPPPKKEQDKSYSWGWYDVAEDPSGVLGKELSIIAGTGRTYAGFPLETMRGK